MKSNQFGKLPIYTCFTLLFELTAVIKMDNLQIKKTMQIGRYSMKKLILFVCICTSFSLFAKAPLSIQGKPVYTGGEVTIEGLHYAVNDGAKNDTAYDYTLLGLGAFYDMYYLRFGMSYAFTADKGQITSDYDAIDGDAVDHTYSFFNIDLIGKYPVSMGSVEVWPALGFQYSVNIEAKDENGDDFEDTDLNDAYLLIGGGLDYDITSSIVISPAVLFGWNLMPETVEDPPDNADYSGYKIDLRIAVGYRL